MIDLCILVSSCDKYSDLWTNHFSLFFENWEGDLPHLILLTDKPTSYEIKNVEIMVIEEHDFPTRLHLACKKIKEEYVLITLDDYYLFKPTKTDYFEYFVQQCKTRSIDYLSIYNRKFTKKRFYTSHELLNEIKLDYPYDVNLYPAIWRREFLKECTNSAGTPWAFEPNLTFISKELNGHCFNNVSGTFDILDVVRKGRLLNKAYRFLKKRKMTIPNRKRASAWMEIKESIANFLSWKLPRPLYRFIRKVAILFGMKSYSNDAYKNYLDKK